jgi:MFS family permease
MSIQFSSIFKKNIDNYVPYLTVLIFSATALGVQRAILSVYTNELESDLDQYLIVGAAFALASFGGSKAIGNFLGGKYGNQIGRNKTVRIGSGILIFGSIILFLVDKLMLFYIGNAFIGLGIGMIFAASTVALTDISTPMHRAKAIGMMELSVYGGNTLGALYAGFTSNITYNISFLIALIIVSVSFLISIRLKDTTKYAEMREYPKIEPLRDKLKVIHQEWLDETAKYEIEIENHDSFDKHIAELDNSQKRLRIGREINISKRLFFKPSFLLVFASGVISRISDSAMILIYPLLIINYGYSIVELGIATSIFTLFWAIGIAIVGPLSDKIGRKIPLFVGTILEATGFILLFTLELQSWFPMIIIGTSIAGLGRGIYFPIPASIASELVVPELKAITLGIYRFVLDMGYVIGALFIIGIVESRAIANGNGAELLEPVFGIIVIMLFLLGFLNFTLMVDPNPGFRQYPLIKKHVNTIRKSIYHSTKSINHYIDGKLEKSRHELKLSKMKERQADQVLEHMTYATYSGALKAVSASELLQFSTKVDKAAGHSIRALRKLILIEEKLPVIFKIKLLQYSKLLKLLVETAEETINLLEIRINLAAYHSYQVSFVEEILDKIHKELWSEIINIADTISPLSQMLLVRVIEYLELSANSLEDGIEFIRLISFKHQIR